MILSAVRKFLENCPCFASKHINADFLSENPESFSVYSENADPLLKKYADGRKLMQFVFSIRMRASYSKKIAENEKISRLFDDISDWIYTQAKSENFPYIQDNILVCDMEVLSQGHLKNTNAADCTYEMKCRILYYKRR